MDIVTNKLMVRPELAALDEYAAPPPIAITAARYGVSVDALVRLDVATNPYGGSLGVQDALAAFDSYNQPPDPLQRELRTLLERYSGYSRERILVGAGDELRDLMIRATCAAGDNIVVSQLVDNLPPQLAALDGVQVVNVPRGHNFAYNAAAVVAAIDERTRLVVVTSPDDPSGVTLDPSGLVTLLQSGVLVAVDERGYEFSGQTLAPLTAEFGNLVVLREFGGWAGLAGLAVSYGIFPRALVPQLLKLRPGYSLSVAATVAVAATLDGLAEVMHSVMRLRKERGRMYRRLRKLNFIQPRPSRGPFLLCKVTRGDAWQIKNGLERRGVFVRYLPSLPDYLAIAIGRPEDTDTLMHALLTLIPGAELLEE